MAVNLLWDLPRLLRRATPDDADLLWEIKSTGSLTMDVVGNLRILYKLAPAVVNWLKVSPVSMSTKAPMIHLDS